MAQPVCDVLVNGSNNVPTHHNIQIIYAFTSSAESQRIAHQTREVAQGSACIICTTAEVKNHNTAKLACHTLQL